MQVNIYLYVTFFMLFEMQINVRCLFFYDDVHVLSCYLALFSHLFNDPPFYFGNPGVDTRNFWSSASQSVGNDSDYIRLTSKLIRQWPYIQVVIEMLKKHYDFIKQLSYIIVRIVLDDENIVGLLTTAISLTGIDPSCGLSGTNHTISDRSLVVINRKLFIIFLAFAVG